MKTRSKILLSLTQIQQPPYALCRTTWLAPQRCLIRSPVGHQANSLERPRKRFPQIEVLASGCLFDAEFSGFGPKT